MDKITEAYQKIINEDRNPDWNDTFHFVKEINDNIHFLCNHVHDCKFCPFADRNEQGTKCKAMELKFRCERILNQPQEYKPL